MNVHLAYQGFEYTLTSPKSAKMTLYGGKKSGNFGIVGCEKTGKVSEFYFTRNPYNPFVFQNAIIYRSKNFIL